MRGIIVMPRVSVRLPNDLSYSGDVDLNLVRLWVLFWDKIATPTTIMVRSLGPEFEFLGSRDIHSYDRATQLKSTELAARTIEARSMTFKKLEVASPGSWSLGSGVGAWDGPETEEGRGLRIELVKALPVPEKDVPLEDILEFRERRRDEREAVMNYIDECYLSVTASPDKPLAAHNALEKLSRAAREQLEVTKESSIPHRLYDLAADFNLVAAGVAATGSIALGATWPVIVGNSILAGGSVTIKNILATPNPVKGNNAFRYVARYHDEVFR
ncbi:hypothetical protein RHIZ_03265 [Rhizobium skierniewicense]|uniref:DUF6236 family protein n=1 Tax=Rhizobium TaxID=379 RepID=UPI001FAD0858|nr:MULTISPECIES: DUF6236 family protein [Rhizobium]MCI9864961.1 hypothetical protein [Rhizobium skierniewicense]